MTKDDLSDDYVANLLKAEAKKSTDRYAMVGLSAMLAKRPTTHAPKPNVRFLRNILRETDSHNSALLAKEAEESEERLRRLRSDRRDRPDGPSDWKRRSDREEDYTSERRSKRKRSYDDDDEDDGLPKHRSREKRERDNVKDFRRSRSRSKDRSDRGRRHHSRDQSDSDDKYRHRRSLQTSKARDHDGRLCMSREHYRKHSSERSPRRPSHRRERNARSPTRSASESDRHGVTRISSHDADHAKKRRNHSPSALDASDSDPLEQFVGPLPPKPKPPVRRSGRGTFSGAENLLDTHFAPDYDASIDVRPLSEDEDDWEQALEVVRDRQRWKQQGADRLRQAGFTDDQVRKWEKGEEKTESDVRWAKKGEGREWDRGKFVDDSGDVSVQAEWARLKGT